MLDSFLNAINTTGSETVTLDSLLISIAVAFVLGLIISIAFFKSQKGGVPSKHFALTLVMLPPVVAVIIMLIGSNIAGAFSMAGAFSIIRFRSTPGSSRDITYVLFSMAVGLACGLGYVLYAGIVAILFCVAIVTLELMNFGSTKTTLEILKVTIPEDLDYKDALTDVLKRYTKSHKLLKVRTTNLGSLYELVIL